MLKRIPVVNKKIVQHTKSITPIIDFGVVDSVVDINPILLVPFSDYE